MSIYSIYDFVIEVQGPVNNIFQKEFGRFKIDRGGEQDNGADFYVRVCKGNMDLPTKPAGCKKGMYLPFGKEEKTLYYSTGLPLHVVLSYCEGFLWWPNMTLLHAGAVEQGGKGLIFTGKGNVGKTSIVLNLLKEGFRYLSDDWLIVGKGKAFAFPKTIRLFDYNLRDRIIAERVLGLKRFLYKPILGLLEIARRLSPHRYIRFALEATRPTFYVDVAELSPNTKVADPCEISKVFYLERRKTRDIQVSADISARELARRMAYVSRYEWGFFFQEYYKYVGSYGIKNPKLEARLNHDFEIFSDLFRETKLYKVIIPFNVDLTGSNLVSILNLKQPV